MSEHAIKARILLEVLRDTVAQFPTFCEGYLNARSRRFTQVDLASGRA